MGLEGVEIVMRVEETFDIAVDDAEAETLQTPGQLIELVMRKVGRTGHAACLTQRAFHRLRAGLMRQFGLARNQIRPDTPLEKIFPRKDRKQQLRQILNELAVTKNVDLVRPNWLNRTIMVGVLGSGVAIAVSLTKWPISSPNFVINFLQATPVLSGIASAFLFGWLAVKLTALLQYEFKPSMTTVAGLSRWVVANNPSLVQAPPGQWSHQQVAEKVREIVIDVLGCEKEYTENAHFVKDLGMG
jgi:acyl carrier protein